MAIISLTPRQSEGRQTFKTLKADRREVFKVLNMAGYSQTEQDQNAPALQ